ncbi:MAG: toxin ParE1/3/4 [Aliidongia sp.]|nr:toxin ParE1/3/4 [Aliidongia sp.]
MKRYRLSLEAQQDIQEIRIYYLKEADARAARHVLGEISAAFRFLATTPGAGHAREDLTDEPVKFWAVLSYLIVYDPSVTPLGIARVLHGSRDIEAMLLR